MRSIILGLMATTLLAGCADYEDHGHMHGDWGRYDYNHPDPSYGGYEAERYYHEDSDQSHERHLSREERIYRGHDGRYYCRHSDGSTGLIVGAIAGGALGIGTRLVPLAGIHRPQRQRCGGIVGR